MAVEGGGDRDPKPKKKKQDSSADSKSIKKDTTTSRRFELADDSTQSLKPEGEKDKDSKTAELGKTPTKYQLGSPEWRLQQWSDFQDKSGKLSFNELRRTDADDSLTEVKKPSSNETTKQNRIHERHYRNYEDYNKILLRAKL
jgi:hypothetical protein